MVSAIIVSPSQMRRKQEYHSTVCDAAPLLHSHVTSLIVVDLPVLESTVVGDVCFCR